VAPGPGTAAPGARWRPAGAARRVDAALGRLEDRERWHREQAEFGYGRPEHHIAVAEYLRGVIATETAKMVALDGGDDDA